MRESTLDILNQLWGLHRYSLPMYLMSAKPYVAPKNIKADEILRHIAQDHRFMADRIGEEILREHGQLYPAEFPMLFTDMHDLSIDYLIPEVTRRLQADRDVISSCVDALAYAPAARALAEEALGAAQAHLDSLYEVQDRQTAPGGVQG